MQNALDCFESRKDWIVLWPVVLRLGSSAHSLTLPNVFTILRLFTGCLLGMLLLSATLFAGSMEDRTVVRHEKGTTDAADGYTEILPDRHNNRIEGQTFPLILTLDGGGGTGNGVTNLGTSSMMKLLNDAIRSA